MNQEKIGKFIMESRKNKNMTQSALAEKLGVSDRTIGNWENGRNMPDLSLFKPLCEILDISINDLISGEVVDKKDYNKKLEENIISTIDYTNKKISNKNNTIGIILIIVGVFISITAIAMFASESSWGSIYSVFGGIVALVGVSRFTKRLSYVKRVLSNFMVFGIYVLSLIFIDFLSVANINQAPRFTYRKITADTTIYYDAVFYDVVRCNRDTKNEKFYILKNSNKNMDEIIEYCENK